MERFKILFLIIGVLLISQFSMNGNLFAADECQDQCTFTTKNGAKVRIAISPDALNNWPIVVTEPGGMYSCGAPENYPCLAWPYQCLGDEFGSNCEEINTEYILISNCCGKPIEILDASANAKKFECDSSKSRFPGICSGTEYEFNNSAGTIPGEFFWFTTPNDVGTDMIDIKIGTKALLANCYTGIRGPGCSSPTPPVRVEPRVQCYQFTAETDKCQVSQTWYAQWAGTYPCAVDVWVAEAENVVSCSEFPAGFVKLEGEALGDITISVNGETQVLTDALMNNSACDEGWLRFVNEEGCNVRCYYSGGRKYCY